MHRRNPARNVRHGTQRGFTLVELVVAAVITSIALLGVYATFVAAANVEARTTARWEHRSAARAVADHIGGTIEGAVNLPGLATISGSPDGAGGYTLECVTQPRGASGAPLLRRRYRWGATPSAGPASTNGLQLQVQTLPYAGTKNLTAPGAGAAPAAEDVWAAMPPLTIASGLSSIEVTYRRAANPEAEWQNHFAGPAGRVAVRVVVRCGGETAERVFVPKTNAALVGSGN
jgi:prepilin-type N-terminal cleavage/methylation domain-containing protein